MPLREGNYNILPIKFPTLGMNTTITPQALPFVYARYLENLIPSKGGTGVVRHGTVVLAGITSQDMEADSKILEVIPFVRNSGQVTTLVYAYDFLNDTTISNPVWLSTNSLQVTVTNPPIAITSLTGVTSMGLWIATAATTDTSGLVPGVTTVQIAGASQSDLNGLYTVQTVSPGVSFTYNVGGGPYTSPDPGTSISFTNPSEFNPVANFPADQPLKIIYQIADRDFTIYPLVQDVSAFDVNPVFTVKITLDTACLPQNEEQGKIANSLTDSSFRVGPLTEDGCYPVGGNVQVAFTIPPTPVDSITFSGTTATVTATGSNLPTAGAFLANDCLVTISGVTGPDADLYNGYFPVTVVDADTFTYEMTSTPSMDAPDGNYSLEPYVRWPTGFPNEGEIIDFLGSPLWQLSQNGVIHAATPISPSFSMVSMTGVQGINPSKITQVTAFLAAKIGLKNGDVVTISGCTPAEFNGTFMLYNISTAGDSFSYDIPGQFLGDASVVGTFTVPMYEITSASPILPSFPVQINAVFNAGPPITLVQHATGAIKTFNEVDGHYEDIASGLSSVCIPRYHAFSDVAGDVVFIYNGVDDLVYWDGNELTTVYDFVPYSLLNKDATPPTTNGDPAYVSQNSFTVMGNPDYFELFVPGSPIQLNIGVTSDSIDSLSITSITNTKGVATVVLAGPSNRNIGDVVTVVSATVAEYNGAYQITAVDNAGPTYTFSYNLTTPAAGPSMSCFYFIPPLNIQSTISGIIPPTIAADGTMTITTVESILPFIGVSDSITINSVFYSEKPPAFSFLSSYNGYLYALGPGVPQAKSYRPFPENLRFYFTGTQYSLTNWINPVTKTPFFQNCQTNQDNSDNFEAIAQVNSGIVFFGRNTLQIWQGINPPIIGLTNQISLTKVMPVGCLHGNLFIQLPNDAAFVSLYGLQTLSSINISQQYAAAKSIGSAVDKTFNNANNFIFDNNRNYRQCRSFKYPIGLFLGFKMLEKVIMFSLTETSQGWFYFSGDFSRATGYAEQGRLLLGIDNKLYRYADDVGAPPAASLNGTLTPGRNWADGNGQNLIEWTWITPWARAGLKRFKNNRYEIYLEPTTTYNNPTAISEFIDLISGASYPDPAFNITISYALNNNISNNSVGVTPGLDSFGAFWNQNYWDGSSWAGTFQNPIGKMKFLSSTFTLLVSGQTNVGPIELYEIRMYGKGEI